MTTLATVEQIAMARRIALKVYAEAYGKVGEPWYDEMVERVANGGSDNAFPVRAALFAIIETTEAAATMAENFSFGTEISIWMNLTKTDVSALACNNLAAALRDNDHMKDEL